MNHYGKPRCKTLKEYLELRPEGFPESLTKEEIALGRNFKYVGRGASMPQVGILGGRRYILKCGSLSEFSSDGHVHNEYVTDCLLALAGCDVPASFEYSVDMGNGRLETVRLAEYVEGASMLSDFFTSGDGEMRRKVVDYVVRTYPLQAFIEGYDTYQHSSGVDNTLGTADGRFWFIDNGASFEYRAKGKKRSWFFERDIDDPETGYLSLAKGTNRATRRQFWLQKFLAGVPDDALWEAASRYDFRNLYSQLPDYLKHPNLERYAEEISRRSPYRAA